MGILGKALGFICALAFIVAAPLAVIAFNAQAQLSTPAVTQLLERENFYDQAVVALFQQARTAEVSPGDPNQGYVFTELEDEELRAYITTIWPREEFNALTRNFTGAVFGYLRGETDTARVTIDLNAIADRTWQASLAAVANKPACVRGRSYALFACRPPAQAMPDFERTVRSSISSTMPSEFVYPPADQANIPLAQRRLVTQAATYAPFIAGGLLVLIALFAVRGMRGLMLWWGWPALFAGGIGLGCWLLMRGAIGQGIAEMSVHAADNALDDIWNEIGRTLLTSASDQYLNTIALQSGVLAGVGLLMTIAAQVIAPRRPEAP